MACDWPTPFRARSALYGEWSAEEWAPGWCFSAKQVWVAEKLGCLFRHADANHVRSSNEINTVNLGGLSMAIWSCASYVNVQHCS